MLDDVTKASTLSCVTVGGAASQAVQAKTLSAVVAQAAAKASTLSCVTVGGAASAAAKASSIVSCVTVGSAAAPAAKASKGIELCDSRRCSVPGSKGLGVELCDSRQRSGPGSEDLGVGGATRGQTPHACRRSCWCPPPGAH